MDDRELLRYSRQLMLPELDVAGQERLLGARVLILGLGGLGSPAALYLASAGVGELVLVDDDTVDLSNLQRQIAHTEAFIDHAKVESAADAIHQRNSRTRVRALAERPDSDRLAELVSACDLVLDATDNAASRFALNAACWAAGVPLVSGAAIRFEGQLAVFDPRDPLSPCYQCLYPALEDQALNCAENGVLSPVVGVIGCCQAVEAIKILCGIGEPLVGFVQYYDAMRADWRRFKLSRRPGCPTCGG